MPRMQYDIDELLASGVQPFDDLDGEAIDLLTNAIGRTGALAVPVVVTAEGVLVDGHQRLRAMRNAGRLTIEATDVRVVEGDPLEMAVQLNVQRRHLSVEEKAKVARRLWKENGWTQVKIARLFGVTQAAVSQWLKDDVDRVRKPRKPNGTPTDAVLAESRRYVDELCNPDLGHWIAQMVMEGDRAKVAECWTAISRAAALIAESVEEGGQ